VNTPNDVTVSVVTDEPANATPSVAPVPAGPTEDNNAANTNDNDTVDTNNDTGNTSNDTGNTDQVVDNSVNTPVTIATPIATAAINANVASGSTPAVDLPGTAGANTSGAASLTISLLFGIIINLL